MNVMKHQKGFTIVELLIVIVIIAILAAITVVAYNGIRERATDSMVKSDLDQATKQIALYRAQYDAYPVGNAGYATLGIKFSWTPVGGNVLLCSNSTGFAIFARHPSNTASRYVVTPSGISEVGAGISWSSAALCGSVPYPSTGWGTYWVTGG